MNIILFQPTEVQLPLARRDPRARHLLEVLRRQTGDQFDAGLINGPRGKGKLTGISKEALSLAFEWGDPPPPLWPIHLLIGLPRPQTARDLLRDATTLGVASIQFVRTDRGEASYASSNLWKTNEWMECVIKGAAQAFCTRLPDITHRASLAEACASLPADAIRLTLDNYESTAELSHCKPLGGQPVVLALGSERGWSVGERALMRSLGFNFVHLGSRVLRTETACVAAVTLLKAKLDQP